MDIIVIAGDLNAKIGNLSDVLHDESIPKRKILDESRNNHGNSLIEFLHDSNSCVLNGRVKDNLDDYTCVSTKGKSVVDYVITQNVNFDKFRSFKILQVNN